MSVLCKPVHPKPTLAKRTVSGLVVMLLSFSVFGDDAGSDDATTELIELLSHSTSVQGAFKQLQYDVQGREQMKSGGHFKLLRPGYFLWEIETPDSQMILATPEFIWHLDRDLETLTRRPLGANSAMSPLQILGGREDILRSGYQVSKLSVDSFLIKPAGSSTGETSAGFSSLVLSMLDGVINSMEIVDILMQRIVITLHEVDTATVLTPDDFAFTPPEGLDLFYYDE